MTHLDDRRTRTIKAVFEAGMSRNAAAERFDVSIGSAVRWAHRFLNTGEWSRDAPGGGSPRSTD